MTKNTRHGTTGREYLRVSVDRSGREKSHNEQHDDNAKAARSLGITKFGTPYRDTGSASRHARKRRDGFDRLLDDLGAGRFGAEVLMLWESSRGSRKVGEWVRLIDLCEKAGVRIAVTTHNRTYDPSNPRDRRTLLEDAVDSEYETSKTSQRGKRAAAAAAVAGLPAGPTPFGYMRRYDPTTRRLIAQQPEPDEAKVVVELFERLAAGVSLTAIARDFDRRGIVSRRGVPFSAQTLRGMALSDTYRGKRVHSPNRHHSRSGTAETIYDAQWDALVSDDVWFSVNQRLRDPDRITTRPGRAKHLLSVTARCDVCGGPLGTTYRFGGRRYQCGRGHTLIDADELDAWAEHQILALLTRPDVLRRLQPKVADAMALRAARNEVARVRAEHADLAAQVGAGKLSAKLAAGAEPAIVARLDQAERRVQELTTPVGLRQLIAPGPKVRAQWNAAPMEVRRQVAALLFVRGVLGVLTVAPVNGGKNTVESRIRLDGKRLRTKKPTAKKRTRRR
jgi:DNA invertase Pin-like site-specific DNA recombinase